MQEAGVFVNIGDEIYRMCQDGRACSSQPTRRIAFEYGCCPLTVTLSKLAWAPPRSSAVLKPALVRQQQQP